MSPQEKIQALLSKSGIPAKEIKCYGSQIMITAFCRDSAAKWARLLSRFATVKNTVKTIDYCKENKNTVMLPSAIEVWRVWATID
jgi:hypothetical protein